MINIVDVTHHYGAKPVLRRVNLTVERGKLIALMGPNGMGKSTLMGVMAGTLWPLRGHVEIDGLRRRASDEIELAIRRKVTYLPADPWLPKDRTGRAWMLAVGRLYGIDEEQLLDHVDRLLTLFDLQPQADVLIRDYSTGQKKKAALCAALVTEAPVMLLDEPFSGGLDPSGILALKRVLQHLAKRDDVTVVMATPVPELVEELADRVAVIRNGQIAAYDTIDALREQTGLPGARVDEVYERLVSPQTARNIERYFQGTLI